MAEAENTNEIPAGLRSGLEIWSDAVRELARAPEFRCVLPSPDAEAGFDIAIERADGRVTAVFGGLIHDCDRGLEEALWWVGRAYSPGWRLRVESIGNRPITFTLENADDAAAASLRSGYVSLLGRWRQRQVATYANVRAIDPKVAGELARRSMAAETKPAHAARA